MSETNTAVDPKGWGYLGAISNYVFVHDPVARKSLVVPVNVLARLQPEPRKTAQGLPVSVVRLP